MIGEVNAAWYGSVMTKDLTISLPERYGSSTSRHALLLTLDPGLPAAEIANRLKEEGILPPMIVAVRWPSPSRKLNPLCATASRDATSANWAQRSSSVSCLSAK